MMQRSCLLGLLNCLAAATCAVDIQGTLLHESGNPVIEAQVRTYALGPEGADGKRKSIKLDGMTDRKGVFRLKGAYESPTPDNPLRLALRMPAGRVMMVDLREDGEVVVVRPKAVHLQLEIKDIKGRALPYCEVLVHSISGPAKENSSFTARWDEPGWPYARTADRNGKVEFAALPPGTQVAVRVRTRSSVTTRFEFTMPESGRLTESVTASIGSTLSGRVLKDGKGVAGVSVGCITREGRRGSGQYIKTDENGHFRFEGIYSGTAQVSLFSFLLDSEFVAKSIQGIQLKEGSEVADLELHLEAGIPVMGQVIDELTNKPIPNAQVRVTSDGNNALLTTDESGFYRAFVLAGEVEIRLHTVPGHKLTRRVVITDEAKKGRENRFDFRVGLQDGPPISRSA